MVYLYNNHSHRLSHSRTFNLSRYFISYFTRVKAHESMNKLFARRGFH